MNLTPPHCPSRRKRSPLKRSSHSFPSPKIFTNALLANHDITSLIRDTEAHERALFSVPPPPKTPQAAVGHATTKTAEQERALAPHSSTRRQTVFNVSSGEVTTGPPTSRGAASHPKRHTAVAAVLGGEMHEQLRRGARGIESGGGGRGRGDVDVEVLLRGAEKLCGVYELPGARERIAVLRERQRNGASTTAYYEAKVAEQAAQLASMNRDWMRDDDMVGNGVEEYDGAGREDRGHVGTEDDLKREEDEAKKLEVKKRDLQARLRAMEKDLGGLTNM